MNVVTITAKLDAQVHRIEGIKRALAAQRMAQASGFLTVAAWVFEDAARDAHAMAAACGTAIATESHGSNQAANEALA